VYIDSDLVIAIDYLFLLLCIGEEMEYTISILETEVKRIKKVLDSTSFKKSNVRLDLIHRIQELKRAIYAISNLTS